MQDLEKRFGVVLISLPTPFPVGPVNAFLIKRDPPVLVDTGLNGEESYNALAGALREHGFTPKDLGAIIVTHGHRDHMGLLGRLLEESDAEAYGHPRVQRLGTWYESDSEARKAFFVGILDEFGVPDEVKAEANSLYDRFRRFSEPFTLDHQIGDEESVLGLRAYYVPGHSPSDTLLVNEDEGYTFVGDHILTGTNPNPLLRRPDAGQPRAKVLVEYQASLRRSRELSLGLCLPGHGGPFDNHVAAVDRILERQAKRAEQVLTLVRDGRETPYAVSRRLFPDLPIPNIHLGLSIAVGHMEALEERGQLTSGHDDGILWYRPTT